MTVSPFDHPILSGLLGDEEVAEHFSTEAEIAAFVRFESALAEAEATEGVISAEAGQAIAQALGAFRPDVARLRAETARDGVVVPELVRQMRDAVGEPYGRYVHFGATSQDVIDTGLVLRLVPVLDIFADRLDTLIEMLSDLDARQGQVSVMAHTRMQAAIPVSASRKIASWRDPLVRHRSRLTAIRDQVAVLHFGGAAGTLEKLDDKGGDVAEEASVWLGLRTLPRARHSERDGFAELASFLSLLTGSLGKIGQDIALMAQSEVGEIRLASGGGSSAMPHKVNPVGAEVLVALARFNATLLSGMHHALLHENERSGSAWTLEWMLLPQMAVATGAALRNAAALLPAITFVENRD
ncbi:MAG TPA: 3-carboxy-cis,cis-muconate cycloisomerase [Rhizobiaceae bacterium]|nr:3-carboxy-cis,cis-muconate cycloisomerase [Rhizobiaceae bacterium]